MEGYNPTSQSTVVLFLLLLSFALLLGWVSTQSHLRGQAQGCEALGGKLLNRRVGGNEFMPVYECVNPVVRDCLVGPNGGCSRDNPINLTLLNIKVRT